MNPGEIKIPVVNSAGDGFDEMPLSGDVASILKSQNKAALKDALPPGILIGTATIAETAVVAILAGIRKVTVTVSGVVPASNYLLFPIAATPAGYAIADVVCTANNTLSVTVHVPAIVLGGSYSIPCRVVKITT